jgi:hypothetical protein
LVPEHQRDPSPRHPVCTRLPREVRYAAIKPTETASRPENGTERARLLRQRRAAIPCRGCYAPVLLLALFTELPRRRILGSTLVPSESVGQPVVAVGSDAMVLLPSFLERVHVDDGRVEI